MKKATKTETKTPAPAAEQAATIVAYKGFAPGLVCRGYQYEVGKTYEMPESEVAICRSAFHACEYPLDVFGYYNPAESEFAVVEQSGKMERHDQDSKVASSRITIKGRLTIAGLVKAAIDFTFARSKPEGETATGDQGAASATGYQGAASAIGNQGAASATGNQGAASATGNQGAASATGDQGAASATGYQGAASATGYQGAASATGDQGAASATGDQGAASATGYRGAASATGYRGAASAIGNQGAASATGNQGAASATGYRGAASATGEDSVACALGYQCRAKASTGNWIVVAHRDDEGHITAIKTAKAGADVKADTWYSLNAAGELEEVQ